jgi:4-alpha-glucanotransferase
MTDTKLLHNFAGLYDVQTVYRDGLGELREAPPEAILSALRSLGAPIETLNDVPNARRQQRQALWRRAIEPVIIVWQGDPLKIKVRLPDRLAETSPKYQIVLENGQRLAGECHDEPGTNPQKREVEGARYITRRLFIHESIPLGYHRLHLELDDLKLESYLFSAPLHTYALADSNAKHWGIFCPLYALWSAQSWGAGDFSDLATLVDFVGALNGGAVATLPMLASFLDEPFDPSPYAPVSRLFWNEFFLDVTKIPELAECSTARAMCNAVAFQDALASARSAKLVDYRKVMALKRKILEALLRFLLAQASERRESFEKFAATHPRARDYAAFRAKVELERKSWRHWEPARRDGALTPNDYDESNKRYHLYVQWQCAEQIQKLQEKARARDTALYLDFPLGVNRDGYDVWRHRDLFVLGASGGAPPDGLFTKGQNWGFPPLHPETIRRQGYRYYIDCLRQHMACAGMLRIDHVMGWHRAFWVPDGFSATDGLYVHYRAQEFYAILSLESHRHHVQIVGENLGTVPAYVNEALARHKILGMHVGQFAVNVDAEKALDRVPANTVASLNTHDTATFMSFWSGSDIQDRVALSLLDESQARNEQQYRAAQREALIGFLRSHGCLGEDASAAAVLRAWLAFLAREDEAFMLVNLEDLWLEPASQNVPGTWQERPNWRRKARFSIEEIRQMSALLETLKAIRDKRGRIG